MRRRSLLRAGYGLLLAPSIATRPRAEEGELDLLLVLAADISHSMQSAELSMQRAGYAAALRDQDVRRAIGSGPTGAIGLLYMEWSGTEDQRVLVPWTRVATDNDAEAFARAVEAAPQRVGSWTSISSAIGASRRVIAAAPFTAERKVVDISGDGENNSGEPVHLQRDGALAEGITINGLPILRTAQLASPQPQPLEEHYRDWVIGGPGAFVLPAHGFEAFAAAVRRKLVLEIAGLPAGAGGRG